ncbi:MAG: hypothetical protein IPH05_03620 [Flavobacteriales bacterium]|nr:hypothetical protein [Flavobacteriales bacterium]
MLSSLRLPFLYQEFDGAAEKTTLKILRAMGRFQLGDDVTEEAITNVLVNEELRKRLQKPHPEEEEAALVRDVLIEEMRTELSQANERAEKAEAEAESHARSKDEIAGQLWSEKERAVAETRREMQETMERLERERNDEHNRQPEAAQGKAELESIRAGAAEKKLREQSATIEGMQEQLTALTNDRAHEKAMREYLGLLAIVLCFTGVAAWLGVRLVPWYTSILGLGPTRILIGLLAFVAGHLILEFSVRKSVLMTSLWPFVQVKKLRIALWLIIIIGIALELVGNVWGTSIQKHLDERTEQGDSTLGIDECRVSTAYTFESQRHQPAHLHAQCRRASTRNP